MADTLGNPVAGRTVPQITGALLAVMAVFSGCGGKIHPLDGSSAGAGVTFTAENVNPTLAVFAPASVRLHPLSRWDALATEPTLLCYIELLDDNEDSIKWPVIVELTVRPTSGSLAAAAAPLTSVLGASSATVRFRFTVIDSDSAARQFDPISRSYLARLAGLPSWAANRPATSVSIRATSPIPPASTIELETDGEIAAAPAPR